MDNKKYIIIGIVAIVIIIAIIIYQKNKSSHYTLSYNPIGVDTSGLTYTDPNTLKTVSGIFNPLGGIFGKK